MALSFNDALNKISSIDNASYWDMCRRFNPTFRSHTSEMTLDEFSEKGFEAITLSGTQVLNEYFEISMRIAFQFLNVARAKNPFDGSGVVAHYNTPNGGFVQRMAVNSIKPVSPAYKGLTDFDSVDPFIVRKPEVSERFFQMNFDYQNFITVQEFQMKTMFVNPNGMGELLAGVMEGLANGYTVQEYVNIKECISDAINSTAHPLQDSQNLELASWTDDPTEAELLSFIQTLKNIATSMDVQAQTSQFNAAAFPTVVNASDMVLLVRAGIKTQIELNLMVGAFHTDYLSLPFEVKEVDNFGGITYQNSDGVDVLPCYDELGVQIGYKIDPTDDTETLLTDSDVTAIDNNEDVLAVLIQKGAVFENEQNPYTVTPIYNPRGMYTNYWANKPNNGINFDYYYNMLIITKPSA